MTDQIENQLSALCYELTALNKTVHTLAEAVGYIATDHETQMLCQATMQTLEGQLARLATLTTLPYRKR